MLGLVPGARRRFGEGIRRVGVQAGTLKQVATHARHKRRVTELVGVQFLEHGKPGDRVERPAVRDRAVDLDDGSRRCLREDVVQHRDLAPIGVIGPPSAGVLRGDRRLQEVLPDRLPARGEHLGLPQRGQSSPDEYLVPVCPVLRLQEHWRTVLVEARTDAGALDLQQRLQPECLGLVGCEGGQHPGQPYPLIGQVGPHPVLAGGGRVPLVENEVDHGHHVVEALIAVWPSRQVKVRASLGQRLLRSGDPLAHGGLGG